MIRCPEDSARLDYLNGVLGPEAAREIELHLESCASCRKELEGWRELCAGLAALPRREPSAALVAGTKRALRDAGAALERSRGRALSRWLLASLPGVAAVGLAVLFTLGATADGSRTNSDTFLVHAACWLALLFVPSIVENVRFLADRRRGPS